MDDGKRQLSFVSLASLSVFAAFYVAFVDALSLNLAKILNFEELFLLGTRYLKTSIFVYTFLLVVSLCLMLSAASAVIQRVGPRLLGKQVLILHFIFFTVFSSLVLIGLRMRFFDNRTDFKRYLVVYVLSGLVVFVILGFIMLRFKRTWRFDKTIGRHAFVLVLFGVLLLFLPHLQKGYLKWSFHPNVAESDLPNVILIVMDTVRADALSCYNPELKTTPYIDSIAAEGTLFSRAISAAPWTAPSHSSIFTGLYPSQHRTAWDYALLDKGFFSLAECLSARGYRTVGFSENAFVSKSRGFNQGFQDYYEMYRYPRMAVASRLMDRAKIILSDYEYTGEYARDTAAYFTRWVMQNQGKKDSKPFFAFINFMPAHLPHYRRAEFTFVEPGVEELNRIEPVNRVPERYYLPQFKLTENELKTLHLLYEGDVSYLDSVIGDIYAFLKTAKLLHNTILVITADHGENFGDHGYFEHFFSLHNTLLHVPLLIRFPKRFKPGTINDDMVSTVFLYQTILELLGEKGGVRPDYPIETRSLLESGAGGFLYAEHESALQMIQGVTKGEAPADFDFTPFDKYMKSIYSPDFKMIWSSNGRSEFYDIKSDWREKENLISEKSEFASALLGELRAWLENLWVPPFGKETRLDNKTEEALKALGYIK